MSNLKDNGCSEYNALTRRQLIQGAAGLATLAGTLPWIPQVAYAQSQNSNRDVLVSIYQRGGADGLSLCAPFGDPDYYAAGVRPTIAIPRPDSSTLHKGLNLDGFFALPEAMAGLLPAYNAKNLLVVHATGSVDPTRSHFDAQHYMEAGIPEDNSVTTGWLGRHLATAAPLVPSSPLRALSLGYNVPLTLTGGDKTLPIPSPGNFGLFGTARTEVAREGWLRADYDQGNDPVKSAADNTLSTIALLKKIDFANYKPAGGAVYPNNSFGNALKAAAALIKAQVGVEAIHIDIGGWDTHSGENPLVGYLANLMKTFGDGIGAFHADIFGGNVKDVTLVTMSEFGRNVRENASGGTDHGHGNCMFVMGGKVAGGRTISKWPGLHQDKLYQGQDLQVTIDHRDILAEIVQKRLNNTALGFVFPNYAPTFRGVIG